MIYRGEENYPDRAQVPRKYQYGGEELPLKEPTVASLKKELTQEKNKRRMVEEQTLQEQMKVLEQINILEEKFIKVEREKRNLEVALAAQNEELREHKKIKGIADSMVRMMEKVQGQSGDLHEAWHWVKKSIGQYQTIKKKALEWKKAYDASQKTFSSCSESDRE